MPSKRLRVIAGPNGSGKSTLYSLLKNQVNLGVWINADEILKHINGYKFLGYDMLGFIPPQKDFKSFLAKKSSKKFIADFAIADEIAAIVFGKFSIAFTLASLSNQTALFLSDFFRFSLIKFGTSFITETVFSHPSKLSLLKEANKQGFKTYLYFIATEKAEINIERIGERVIKGGHDVSAQKIKERFPRSIKMLNNAIPICSRVFIFDNTNATAILVASFSGRKLDYLAKEISVEWVNKIIEDHQH